MARYPNVVVLIPGILGSALAGPDGRELWGTAPSVLFKNLATLGSRLDALELQGDDPEVDDIGDGIRPTRPIADLHLMPGLWKIDGYTKIRATLVDRFGLDPGRNFFELAYDWRRDNRVAARALARQAPKWLEEWRESSGNASARLVIVAHSMGGLVARHFLEVLEGWRHTALLATFGTPFRGAPKALGALANGLHLGGVADVSKLVRSMTSVHQLLPIYPVFVRNDFSTARLREVSGIPNLSADRVADAHRFHDDIREAQASNALIEGYTRDFRVLPFIGTEQATSTFARASRDGVELLLRHDGKNYRGDGTVPRVSALPFEMTDDTASFVADAHASLQNADAALVHLCGRLEGSQINYAAFRTGIAASLGLDIEDAYATDRPIELKAWAGAYRQGLRFAITEVETEKVATEGWLWDGGDNEFRGEVRLPPGVYRIQLTGEGSSPVTDIFTVF
ncbi:UNVERIFIED_ORG: hypothetical protein M2438_003177 [Methylobacterium sp. SuP10 SLI 274]|uniref:lipase/acyltransferase domain-containing protein n=1 Tax=Methylorubrum extorquens TaxID=408 RepID=UPI00209DC354|nr:hypothetical protein [Methylorubrum extorquens]MDF9864414.1 hypothetical protein [Methylorubrum pseudosasae]MDH6638002.1 hypothetical protein [Methylobacterium sp. SuP10 SLI 274]MDH6667184.1 hypothetical protein [Methylorubrum zatmanii]MCP1559088.1 hypothetical protein [Methylorubrum extorquens]MDF9792724.1 hypothetical protein [Methylorubrum extorquens]